METNKNNKGHLFQKAGAILALLLGMMSVFAGSKVLLEIDAKDLDEPIQKREEPVFRGDRIIDKANQLMVIVAKKVFTFREMHGRQALISLFTT